MAKTEPYTAGTVLDEVILDKRFGWKYDIQCVSVYNLLLCDYMKTKVQPDSVPCEGRLTRFLPHVNAVLGKAGRTPETLDVVVGYAPVPCLVSVNTSRVAVVADVGTAGIGHRHFATRYRPVVAVVRIGRVRVDLELLLGVVNEVNAVYDRVIYVASASGRNVDAVVPRSHYGKFRQGYVGRLHVDGRKSLVVLLVQDNRLGTTRRRTQRNSRRP